MSGEKGRVEGKRVVAFSLYDKKSGRRESYGVDVEQVREIRALEPITRIPKSRRYVKGVVNLRGRVVAVIDLKLRLGMQSGEETNPKSRVLISDVGGTETGFLVDEVQQVLRLPTKDFELPSAETARSSPFITGLAKVDGDVIVVLDLSRLLEDSEADLGERSVA